MTRMSRVCTVGVCLGLWAAIAACSGSTPQTPVSPTTAPQTIAVTPANASLSIGQTQQMSAAVAPAGASQSVTWSITPTTVATINSSGLVTAVAPGQATVTATSTATAVGAGKVLGTALVTVSVPPPANPPYISASVLTVLNGANYLGDLQQVKVCTDSSCATPITTANVTYDGIQLNYSPVKLQYTGNIAVAPSHTFNLNVALGGYNYLASATQFAAFPTVTSPSPGASWDAGSANTVTWVQPSPSAFPADFFVGIVDSPGRIFWSDDFHVPTPLVTESDVVKAGWTSTPGDYYLGVGIGTQGFGNGGTGLPIGGAAPGSGLKVGGINTMILLHVF